MPTDTPVTIFETPTYTSTFPPGTLTATPTNTLTNTITNTLTSTSTDTPIPTDTPVTILETPTYTWTFPPGTLTATPSNTATNTNTITPTITSTNTPVTVIPPVPTACYPGSAAFLSSYTFDPEDTNLQCWSVWSCPLGTNLQLDSTNYNNSPDSLEAIIPLAGGAADIGLDFSNAPVTIPPGSTISFYYKVSAYRGGTIQVYDTSNGQNRSEYTTAASATNWTQVTAALRPNSWTNVQKLYVQISGTSGLDLWIDDVTITLNTTPTITPTTTVTNTPTLTPTRTITNSPTPTPTGSATYTPSGTPTPTLTYLAHYTNTPTPVNFNTATPTPTKTSTPSSSPTVTPTAYPLGSQILSILLPAGYCPMGVAAANGYIAVSNGGATVLVYNSQGVSLYSVIPNASGAVTGVAIDDHGELYSAVNVSTLNGYTSLGGLSYAVTGCVVGHYLSPSSATYDYTWTGQGTVINPYGVKIDPSGNLVVTDQFSGTVLNLSWENDTVLNQTTGFYGKPCDLAVDPIGNIYVAEAGYSLPNVIYEFNPQYKYVRGFGVPTAFSPVTETSPTTSVAVDSQGNLFFNWYATIYSNITYTTSQDNFVYYSNSLGTNLGGYAANYPQLLWVDTSDNLYVADSGACAVNVYSK